MRLIDVWCCFALRCAAMAETHTIPFIAADQVRAALPYLALIHALRVAFAESDQVQVPRRHAHLLPEDGTLLLMPAWRAQRQLGIKLVTVTPRNRERDLPTVHALYVLSDTETGVPIAIIDGEVLTLRRTAAVSALASRYLSRPDSRSLLIVGTGRLAPEMVVAHCVARDIERVMVWGRSERKALETIERIRQAGLPEHVSIDIELVLSAACAEADIICCATTSTEPLLRAEWVKPGTHIDLVGGFRPNMREADDALMSTAALFVDTLEGALAEAGDLVQPMQAGLLQATDIRADLGTLARASKTGRQSAQQITLFKSVGSALADLAAAGLVQELSIK
jgi:ornithine cyclodeaminase